MSIERKLKFIASLILVAVLLSSCSQKIDYEFCPTYPVGGKKVADELKNIPYQGYEATWEWIARINKLREELELCK